MLRFVQAIRRRVALACNQSADMTRKRREKGEYAVPGAVVEVWLVGTGHLNKLGA